MKTRLEKQKRYYERQKKKNGKDSTRRMEQKKDMKNEKKNKERLETRQHEEWKRYEEKMVNCAMACTLYCTALYCVLSGALCCRLYCTSP
jgi:hypothetical protein